MLSEKIMKARANVTLSELKAEKDLLRVYLKGEYDFESEREINVMFDNIRILSQQARFYSGALNVSLKEMLKQHKAWMAAIGSDAGDNTVVDGEGRRELGAKKSPEVKGLGKGM